MHLSFRVKTLHMRIFKTTVMSKKFDYEEFDKRVYHEYDDISN